MINEVTVRKYCREDISMIENYEQAIADAQTWHCHHRDEIKILPSGITVIHSVQDLKDAGRYYGCPANELIFLTVAEHIALHHTGERHPMHGKPSPNKGKAMSVEQKQKISEANKGRTFSALA